MKVVVLGAGVIGVTTAWYLAKQGHRVTVIDREPASGLVTSFANGGQISVSQAQPWANPGAPAKIIKWLGREDAPLKFRLRADSRQWSWALRFLIECLPGRTRKNTLDILRLGIYSREKLQSLRGETGIQYDEVTRGILQIHTDEKEFSEACKRINNLTEHGLQISICDYSRICEIEPAFEGSRLLPIVGATYAADDESGDAHVFTQRLSALAKEKFGVEFLYRAEITGFVEANSGITGVRIKEASGNGTVEGDAFVVALGCHSPFITKLFGVDLPVFPVKGYSLTVPVIDPSGVPTVCITDESGKIAMSRLGDKLRMAGTAELNGFDTSINLERCDAIASRVKSMFPNAGLDHSRAIRWAGLRPTTPSNVPYIGRTAHKNVYLNTGHGTLGWTLACGSGSAVADLVSGKDPLVNFPFSGK